MSLLMKNYLFSTFYGIVLSLAFSTMTNGQPPVGLVNFKNSCFMNAALQSLGVMEGFLDIVFTKENYYEPNTFATACLSYLHEARNTDKKIIKPEMVCQKGWEAMQVKPGIQQDAGEFLMALLDHLNATDIKPEIRDNMPVYPGSITPQNDISLLFYAITKNGRKNDAGEEIVEAHNHLLLPVHNGDFSLYQCFKHYFDEDEDKKIQLVETQDYMIVGLQRNEPIIDPETGKQVIDKETKIPQMIRHRETITFPLTGLDLSHFYADARRHPTYDLIAVIMHSGTALAGHYTAYVNKHNQWYYCNDEKINSVSNAAIDTIREQGFGADKNVLPLLFIYERSNLVEARAQRYPKAPPAAPRQAIVKQPAQPAPPQRPIVKQPARNAPTVRRGLTMRYVSDGHNLR